MALLLSLLPAALGHDQEDLHPHLPSTPDLLPAPLHLPPSFLHLLPSPNTPMEQFAQAQQLYQLGEEEGGEEGRAQCPTERHLACWA